MGLGGEREGKIDKLSLGSYKATVKIYAIVSV